MRKQPTYIHFLLDGKRLAAYSIRGTFPGELAATRELLAYENGVSVENIRVVAGSKSKIYD